MGYMEEIEHQFSDIPQLVWFWVKFINTVEWDYPIELYWCRVYPILELV